MMMVKTSINISLSDLRGHHWKRGGKNGVGTTINSRRGEKKNRGPFNFCFSPFVSEPAEAGSLAATDCEEGNIPHVEMNEREKKIK